jgi:hypothetical protein
MTIRKYFTAINSAKAVKKLKVGRMATRTIFLLFTIYYGQKGEIVSRRAQKLMTDNLKAVRAEFST